MKECEGPARQVCIDCVHYLPTPGILNNDACIPPGYRCDLMVFEERGTTCEHYDSMIEGRDAGPFAITPEELRPIL